MEFKYAYACSGTYQAQSLLFSNKNRNFSSPNRDPCVTILSVTVEMLYMHAL